MDRVTGWCLIFALAGVVDAAGASTCDRLEAATWLLGEWTAQDGDKVVLESWRLVSPDTFEGLGETRAGADRMIVAAEALRLVRMADGVFYVAKVAHNPYPVSFRLTDCPPARLVFENPTHDFPRRLEYTLAGDGLMTVAISDGAGKGFTLSFRRREDRQP